MATGTETAFNDQAWPEDPGLHVAFAVVVLEGSISQGCAGLKSMHDGEARGATIGEAKRTACMQKYIPFARLESYISD